MPLADSNGTLTHVFPTPSAVAGAPLERSGLTRSRAASLRGFAAAVADRSLDLGAFRDLDDAIARLTALPGIGDWTAQYVAMRALGEPDAFPAGDLGVRQALARAGRMPSERETRARAERWRPWRAYAVLALWTEPRKPAARRTPVPRRPDSLPPARATRRTSAPRRKMTLSRKAGT